LISDFYKRRISAMNQIEAAIEAAGGPSRVAKELGVSVQAVCFWRDGKREIPPEHLAILEGLCGGAVRRWHMRPKDWHLIWPELVGMQGAPAIEAATSS